VVERLGRSRYTDHEREIEEQLERCRAAVFLGAVTDDGVPAQPAESDGRSARHPPMVCGP
jgi:hypothetical protein